MAKQKGLEIDRRVGIALSVLPPSQRNSVERLIASPKSFERAAALPGRVQQMHTSGQPLYMMRVSPSLRLIYTMVGDTIYVVDLVERATLDRFALQKAAKASRTTKTPTKVAAKDPKAVARKSPDPVEK